MIEILDSFFAKKNILRRYTYAQYINCFREVGTFEIHAQLVDENIYLLDKTEQYYVLFYDGNKPILGKIEDVKRESDEQYDIVVKLTGRLAPVLFTQRVINGTQKFSGKTYQHINTLISNNVAFPGGNDRRVPMELSYENEQYMEENTSQIERQVTGGYVWDEIQKDMEQDSLGVFLYPNVGEMKNLDSEHPTNITIWYCVITPGNDRSKGNKQGNTPVIFSQQLSNINRTDYEYNTKGYTNVAYIAGEGEGEDRKWYEIEINNDVEKKQKAGWGRKELWIDARDIQSKNEDGTTMSDEDYELLISQRANEKAADNTVQETYEATVSEENKRYRYGSDYYLGDWVTIEDRNLNISINAQITKVTHTIQGTREIRDITFMYGKTDKDPVEQINGSVDKIEQNSNDIKYIENKLNSSTEYYDELKESETIYRYYKKERKVEIIGTRVDTAQGEYISLWNTSELLMMINKILPEDEKLTSISIWDRLHLTTNNGGSEGHHFYEPEFWGGAYQRFYQYIYPSVNASIRINFKLTYFL